MTATDLTEQRSVRVVLMTTLGDIDIIVHVEAAPRSAAAFLKFVDDDSFARRGSFYRSVRGNENDHGHPVIDVVQGGVQNPPVAPPCIEHEPTSQTGLKHVDGTVSLARGPVGTATGAVFFICIGEHPCLDAGGDRNPDGFGFAAFGHVARGMEVVHAIHRRQTASGTADAYLAGQLLDPPVRIVTATRMEQP